MSICNRRICNVLVEGTLMDALARARRYRDWAEESVALAKAAISNLGDDAARLCWSRLCVPTVTFTARDRSVLNARENRASNAIYRDKHNGRRAF
jgi:hypothetical protein